jgi:succinyl-CoA synthetase alpha subunit
MAIAVRVLSGVYHDSVKLMRISAAAWEKPGIRQAVAVLGTPMNREQLSQGGLLSGQAEHAGPNDLVLAVEADSLHAAEDELASMEADLSAPRSGGGAGVFTNFPVPTLDAALGKDSQINLALFSIPGPNVRREAERALRKGLHCLIFSDNVSVEDEVALKRLGRERGLLVMGPDCGTAHIGGVGLGFCNVMRPGKIGVVGASGTGIQEVMAAIDAAGGGISCALGTGGRDVSDAVGGLAMIQSIEMLAEDSGTEVLLILGKPPGPMAMEKVLETAARCGKPTGIHFVGVRAEDMRNRIGENNRLHVANSLAAAGRLSVSLSGGADIKTTFDIGPEISEKISEWSRRRARGRRFLRGVYTGGTLCAEAQVVIGRTVPGIRSNAPIDKINGKMADPTKSEGHSVVDLGDDLFTRGKPHPMIDPEPRNARLTQEAEDSETAVVLFDVVLGLGSHEDPAGEVAKAIEGALVSSPDVLFVGSVTGTGGDPQNLKTQRARLAAAGALVADTHVEACLAAAAALKGVAK